MTYQHALQYLLTTDRSDQSNLPIEALHELVEPTMAMPFFICFSHDKQARAAALLLRSMLVGTDIGCLHVIDAPECEARERLVLDGKPLSPTVLCPHAHAVRSAELTLRRKQGETDATFPLSERTAAVLLRCAREQHVRVVLLESNTTHLLRAFSAFAPLDTMTVVSATDVGGRVAISTITQATTDVITHACGATVIRALSDACARAGIRLTVIPRAGMQSQSVTVGSQQLDCALLKNCRLPFGSGLALDAAVLALQAVSVLRRIGLPISDDHMRTGLSRAALTDCLYPISIQPLILCDRVENVQELEATLRDLGRLDTVLARPRHIRTQERYLATLRQHAKLYDQCSTEANTLTVDPSSVTLLVGSADFLQEMLQKSGIKQKKV